MNTQIIERYAVETAEHDAKRLSTETGIGYEVIIISEGVWAAVPCDDVTQDDNAPSRTSHNKILDDEVDYFELDLLKHVPDSHILKRLSIATANAIQLPVSSVFLAGLGVFSSISCRRYVVAYQHGGDVPIGLYTIIEQPSGTGKSWCLTTFQKPFFKAHDAKVKAYQKQLTRLKNIP